MMIYIDSKDLMRQLREDAAAAHVKIDQAHADAAAAVRASVGGGDTSLDAEAEAEAAEVARLQTKVDEDSRTQMRVLMCEACGIPMDQAHGRSGSSGGDNGASPSMKLRERELRVTQGETHKLAGVKTPADMRALIEYALYGVRRVQVAV